MLAWLSPLSIHTSIYDHTVLRAFVIRPAMREYRQQRKSVPPLFHLERFPFTNSAVISSFSGRNRRQVNLKGSLADPEGLFWWHVAILISIEMVAEATNGIRFEEV